MKITEISLDYIHTSLYTAETAEKLEYWRGYLTALLHRGHIPQEVYQEFCQIIDDELWVINDPS